MVQLSSVTVGVVVAAGSGSRLGAGIPKAFVKVGGVPMVQRAIVTLQASGGVSSVIVVVPPDWEGEQLNAVSREARDDSSIPLAVIRGGTTRQESVARAIFYSKSSFSSSEYIVIHDAARCLTPPAVVRRVAEAAWSFGAATAAVPVVDTLRRVVGEQQSSAIGRGEPRPHGENSVGSKISAGTICGELDREGVWHIQTPQAFEIELLSRAHEAAQGEATDDTSLVTPFHPVQIVAGSRFSFKITTPEDLEFAEALAGR